MTEALYIHIPFCEHICAYCDFAKVLSDTFSHKEYLDCLIREIESEQIPEDSLKTIYVGGGTPSALSEEELAYLLSYLHSRFPHVREFTLEANPESLSEEKIRICLRYGVNRISVGAQSGNDRILQILHRHHTRKDIIDCSHRLLRLGLSNFNFDFIYGLPGMSKEDLQQDFLLSKELGSKHLSYYSLQIEPGTLFYNQKVKGSSDDEMRSMYDETVRELSHLGYQRYEISNFAIPGYESRHNLTYWHDETYFAAGLSASGYLGNKRFTNTRSMNHYLQGKLNRSIDTILKKDEEFEFLMLNLRLVSGFSLDTFKTRFKEDFLISYQKEIRDVEDYVEVKSGRFSIKPDYLYTMDQILLSLLKS